MVITNEMKEKNQQARVWLHAAKTAIEAAIERLAVEGYQRHEVKDAQTMVDTATREVKEAAQYLSDLRVAMDEQR